MSAKFPFILAITCGLASSLLFSCAKQNDLAFAVKNLYGKWRLTDIYDRFDSGIVHEWRPVRPDEAHSLEFTRTGDHKKTEGAASMYRQCSGIYKMLTLNQIEITSPCAMDPEIIKISEPTKKRLIIELPGTEGIIWYRYEASK
jgi:hypothetical protein